MNGLEKITNKILGDAREEAARIRSDSDAEIAQISQEYAQKSDRLRREIEDTSERAAASLIAKEKAIAATYKKNLLLQTRGELVDEAFQSTYEVMKSLGDEQYTNLLIGLLAGAMMEQAEAEQISASLYGEEEAQAPEYYDVILSPRDKEKYADALLSGAFKKLAGKLPEGMLSKLRISESTQDMDGGFILSCGDIQANCTLSVLFAGLREELETEIGRVLFEAPKQY